MARRNRGQREPGRQRGRQVLQGMHGVVDLFSEEPLAFELVQGPIHLRITPGLDDDQLGADAACCELVLHPLGLPSRQRAPPRADLHANRRASESTSPGTVCGLASMMSRSPRSRAVPAVTGPIVAATKRPEVAAGSPTRSTNDRTVEDDVNVTASMRPSVMSLASRLRSVWTGTVRYTAIAWTSAPCCRNAAASASRASSALGISTRAPTSDPRLC